MTGKGLIDEDMRDTDSDKKLYTNRVKCQTCKQRLVLTLLTIMLRSQLPVIPEF